MATTASNRRTQPGGWGESAWIWLFIGTVVLVVGGVYAGVHVGHRLAGLEDPPGDPWRVLFGVLDGSVAWPPESTFTLIAAAVLLAGAGTGVWLLARRRRTSRHSRSDWSATYLGRGTEISGLTKKNATASSRRLGVDSLGLPLGVAVSDGRALYQLWEDVAVLIAGPRVGKTVAYAIPSIMAAPGAVVVTSNKRDLVDATRGPREGLGDVWVFDPQRVAEETPTWWWNPLSYVTDETKAATLADHFASGSRSADAKTDAFFDPAARDLLAGLLLAAAVGERPITQVYQWLTRPTDDTPVQLLQTEYPMIADQVAGVVEAPGRQRGGVYGTAQQMASCLTSRAVLAWVTPPLDHGFEVRPHFDVQAFVASADTLYSLSREGRGNAGPLVTALTVAVVEAAEELATRQPGGRLATPMVGVLDEAANVCRWRDLPDLYSHYGSRGIVLQTILQSWSQGEQVWGKTGMNKLWSAANVAIYAGGVKEEEFLERLSKLVGSYDKVTRSVSSRSHRGAWGNESSTSRQLARERILDVDELAALPRGRAVVLSSGNRPTLARTTPWTETRHAAAIKQSLAAHGPAASQPSHDPHHHQPRQETPR